MGNGTTGTDNGNVASISNCNDATRSASYDYDVLNRLSHAYTTSNAGSTSWGETYTIDAWGNMTQTGSYSGRTNHESLSTSASTNNQMLGFTYDAAGNMTQNGSTTYTYDAESRITATSGSTYVYDGDGSRVKKSGANPKLYWRGTGMDALAERPQRQHAGGVCLLRRQAHRPARRERDAASHALLLL